MSILGDVAGAITGSLGSVGNFFGSVSTDLTDFISWLDTDVIDFFGDVEEDLKNFISFVGTAISDISSFLETIAQEFIKALQTVGNAIYQAGTSFISFMEGLAKDAVNALSSIPQDILNFTLNVAQGFANTFSGFLTTAFGLIFNAFNGQLQYISPFVSTLPQLLLNYFGPAMIGKYGEVLIDKITDFLPEIDVDLSPAGIGGKFKIDLPKIVKGIAEPIKDFMGDVVGDITSTFKEFIKEPFISDFKIHIREIFDEIGLGDIPFADPQFAQISNWVSARSFDELKPHFQSTLLLTGFPAWFTNAYLEDPVNDYVPRNPLFRPVDIKDVIQGVEYGFLPSDAVAKYAQNNLLTPVTAQLMYENQTAKFVQRAIEQGIRQFVVKPEDALKIFQSYSKLTGTDLMTKYFDIEYQYAEKRLVRQVLRSVLSRALSNFGKPYIEVKELDKTITKLFKELQYPKIVEEAFYTMIDESQLVQFNQLLYQGLVKQIETGIYDQKDVEKVIKDHEMNAKYINELISQELTLLTTKATLSKLEFRTKNFLLKEDEVKRQLKSLKYDDTLADAFIYQYYREPLLQFQLKYVEEFTREGYYDRHEARRVLGSLGVIKEFSDVFEEYVTQSIEQKSFLQELEFRLKNFLLKEKDAEHLMKSRHFSEALISSLITQYYTEPFTQLQLKYIESQAKIELLDEATLSRLLESHGIVKDVAEIYAKMFSEEYYTSELVNYYRSLASHGILENSKDIPKTIYDLKVKPAYDEYLLTTTIRYIEQNLKSLLLDEKKALVELKKLKVSDDIANLIVNSSIPTLFSVKSIAQNLIEGAIYGVGKVPVNLGHLTPELKKLNIPEAQIPVLENEIATSIALEIWKKYLPSLSDIENAVKIGYPIEKLAKLALVPSELLNVKLDLLQYQQVATLVQSLRSYYVDLLTYGVNESTLETMLRKYGVTEAMLSVMRTEAEVKREVTVYQELGITPSKALNMSDYVENPDTFLKKIFDQYHVPADLQNQYLSYARNRRLERYISQIIETLALLAEKKKIGVSEAQQLLGQFKKYGLTDEEIQLITYNIQLRMQY